MTPRIKIQSNPTRLGAIGAVLGGLAVLLGAFGTHVLADTIPPGRLETFATGARYHLIHSVLLVAISFTPRQIQVPSGFLILAGTLVFSGSLYLLALTGHGFLGAVAPVGGILLVAGWLSLGARLFSLREATEEH